MRRPFVAVPTALALSVTLAGAAMAASPLAGNTLPVAIGQAAYVSLGAPVRDIVVGDPQVADVNVINERTLVVMGKKPGTTTLLAFDGRGRTLADRPVVVSEPSDGTVVIQRGATGSTYACGDRCTRLTPAAAATPAN
ncbi:MAG: pilus assembly protein N-terminal domain-containing protein [Caulobacter sp.]|nr:pilus assembly protein N-terminal domain-containing protein [Caulobacter sp.]